MPKTFLLKYDLYSLEVSRFVHTCNAVRSKMNLKEQPDLSSTLSPPVKTNRLIWIDCLRGLAAILVVYFHISIQSKKAVVSPDGPLNLGLIAVFVFFIISGFVIRLSLDGIKYSNRFLLRRIARVYPPYLICMSIAILLCFTGIFGEGMLLKQTKLFKLNSSKYILGVMTMEFENLLGQSSPLGVYWTLSVELVFYTQIFLIVKMLPSVKYSYLYILICFLSLVSDWFRYLPFLYFGNVYWDYHTKKMPIWDCIPLAFLLPLIYYFDNPADLKFPLSAIFALLIFHTAASFNRLVENRTTTYLGKISYSLYLVHMLVLGVNQYFQVPLPVFSGVMFSLATSHFFYRWIETPFVKISRKLQN